MGCPAQGDAVTKIEAIVRPSTLDDVKKALDHEWIAGMTVSEVKAFDGQGGHAEVYRGTQGAVDPRPRLKVEIVVPDPLVPRVLHDLEHRLKTGRSDDGQIFATRVVEAIRIRTGERGEDAL
jgi:nitrogen regulatory protein P-II 1